MVVRPSPTRPEESALADWANDDLLLSDSARESLEAQHPRVFALLDWPALRGLFAEHDGAANREKRRVRKAGRRAVWSAFLTFSLAALLSIRVGAPDSLVSDLWTIGTGLGTAVFATVCIVTGLRQMLHGGRKRDWMIERLWTETLRRFYFQFLLRNLPTAVAVIDGRQPVTDWRTLQERALAALRNEEIQRPADLLRDVLADRAERKSWVLADWRNADRTPTPTPGPALDELLAVLETKRLVVQRDYTRRKLEGSRLALRGRSNLIRTWFYILVFIVLGLDAVAGLSRVADRFVLPMGGTATWLTLGAAVAGAALIALQMWERGERVSTEADRMEWYLAGVDSVHRRYQDAHTLDRKIAALADLETLAYQEMRQFLADADRGEFLAG